MIVKRRRSNKPGLTGSAEKALRRAARRARETARRYGTLIYVSRAGKIVATQP